MGCAPCLALGTYRPPPPPTPRVDARGRKWCSTGMVIGECEDHLLPYGGADGPLFWDSEMAPRPTTPAAPPAPPPPRPPVALRGVGSDLPPVVVWVDDSSACSMPTLPGMIAFGLLGAHAASRSRRSAGAMDGVFGSWIGCAAASALGLPRAASTILSLVGAYYAAKTFDGAGR